MRVKRGHDSASGCDSGDGSIRVPHKRCHTQESLTLGGDDVEIS